MKEMEIRRPRLEDAPSLAQFAAARFCDTFGHLYDSDDLQEHLEQKYTADVFKEYILESEMFLVAAFAENGEIVGYAKAGNVEVPFEPRDENCKELHRLYVRDDMKGTGLGLKLYQLVLDYAKSEKASELYLGVWAENARAIAFYTRQGFEIVGKYLYQVGQTFDDERIMRLNLVK
ncbi:MAG: GNAT family N-acetyltransferase [Pseudomonadota bacterium]